MEMVYDFKCTEEDDIKAKNTCKHCLNYRSKYRTCLLHKMYVPKYYICRSFVHIKEAKI